jgi:ferritin-like protein
MPTQEERLKTVEFDLKQFKTETIRAYQYMAFEMTMVKGLTEDAIKRLATLSGAIEKRFDAVNERLDSINGRLEHLDTIEQRLNQLETKFDKHTALLTQILARLPKAP